MMHLTPRALLCVALALASAGCKTGGSGGGTHTANSFAGGGHSSSSSASSGSSHSSSWGSGSGSGSRSGGGSGSGSRTSNGSYRPAEIVAHTAAAVALKLAEIAAGGSSGGGDTTVVRSSPSDPPPRPASDCEEALLEWREIHRDPGLRVPPQLRCGPNGEWGGEWSRSAPPPPASVTPAAPGTLPI